MNAIGKAADEGRMMLLAGDIGATTRLALHSPIAVLAPGTGLGEAFLIWSGEHYVTCASEGGMRTSLQQTRCSLAFGSF